MEREKHVQQVAETPQSTAGGNTAAQNTAEGQPAAPRLRRPSWRDPRLLAGILIVLASVAGVVALVAAQDRTVPVYAADRGLPVGAELSPEDLRAVNVRLEDGAGRYLSAQSELPEDRLLIRAVEEGELLPASALAEADPEGRQPVTVEVTHELAAAVRPGSPADVWAARSSTGEDEAEVQRIVSSAEVADIREPDTTLGGQQPRTLELLITAEEVPELLASTSSQTVLTVLPAGAGPEGQDDGV